MLKSEIRIYVHSKLKKKMKTLKLSKYDRFKMDWGPKRNILYHGMLNIDQYYNCSSLSFQTYFFFLAQMCTYFIHLRL